MEKNANVVEFLENLLKVYGFEEIRVEEETVSAGENTTSKVFILHVSEENSRFLIGQYGNNLQALQHIARMIIGKTFPEMLGSVFFLDVNDYRKKKDQSVIDLARSAAREAVKEGNAVVLRPMSAYERRLVHLELLKERNVITESVGEGEERRIYVRPIQTPRVEK